MLSGLQTRTVLRNLIQLCRNGERGFSIAREGLTDGQLRGLFRQFAEQRAQQAAEVSTELEKQYPGAVRDDSGAAGGDYLPCAWTRIRSAVHTEGESSLVGKCGEGTESLLRTYEDLLRAPLPRNIHALLYRHFVETRSMHGVLKSLACLD